MILFWSPTFCYYHKLTHEHTKYSAPVCYFLHVYGVRILLRMDFFVFGWLFRVKLARGGSVKGDDERGVCVCELGVEKERL